MPTQSRQLSLKFINKESMAKGVSSFYFDRSGIDYDFFPGQYNRVTLPINATDGKGPSRFFTISSSPLEKEFISITTKEGQSDFKKKFFSLTPSEAVSFYGPMGGFYLDENDNSPRVFLAGGIGITPFHSMLLYAAGKKLRIPLTLIVSFSVPEEMVFYSQLSKIAEENENIKVVYTITHPEESQQTWDGEKGRISPDLITKYVSDVTESTYYIVGPPPMVDGTEEMLEKMGINSEKIKIEQFTGY